MKEKERKEEEMEDDGHVTVVLAASLHCRQCAKKVVQSLKRLEDVKEVEVDESNTKLSITGKLGMNPSQVLTKVEAKTHKKATMLSFSTHGAAKAKEEKAEDDSDGGGSGEEEEEDGGRVASPQSAMAVLRVGLHCEGCMKKVKERIVGMKGVEWVEVDLERSVVVVGGGVSVESLVGCLEEELARKVEVVAIVDEEGGGRKDDATAAEVKEEEKMRKEAVRAEAKKREVAKGKVKKVIMK